MSSLRCILVFSLAVSATSLRAADPADILVADFEGDDYGNWQVGGNAFGTKPARGTLPGQMPVSGFLGKGLVNSFLGGDDARGKLTSPPFVIERRHINFLVGGGKYPRQTCLNLIVGGKTVRTATGPNDQPGGTEALDWSNWDVGGLEGQTAVIEIVDDRQGGWGHINVDQIVQSNRPQSFGPARRELLIEHRYLYLPVKTGGRKVRMKLVEQGRLLREFEIELADGTADFQAWSDVGHVKGRRLTVEVDRIAADSTALAAIEQGDEIPAIDALYTEPARPQFHFTSRRGWLNDPNGLVHARGEWHLFYQHNPYGWNWGNMHWGHAVSRDLLHWQELPIALTPQRLDDACFSGSAVVDSRNTSGFKTGTQDVLVAAYTSTGRGECIVSSNDDGRTWTEFSGNPVVKHAGRDPKLLWHEPSKSWVMAVYDEFEGKRQIALYTAPDLKAWTFQSRIDGFFECPDLFEASIEGLPGQSRWVMYAADGKYVLGSFDGRQFVRETGPLAVWYGNFYAAQSFDNAPDGRRVQIGWGQGIEFRGSPFNQQMTVPVELSLRSTPDGPRLFAEPVRELAALYGAEHRWADLPVTADEKPLTGVRGDLFRIMAEIEPGTADTVGFIVRGVPVRFDAARRELVCRHVKAPLSPIDGRVVLDILVDRGSIEVFGNRGQVALSVGGLLDVGEQSVRPEATGSGAKIRSLRVIELKSAWK